MSKKLLSKFVFINCLLFTSITLTHAQSDDYIVHTVKHGEVPSVLAKKYNVSLDELASLNKWGPKVILHVGDKIKLPASAHVSQTPDSTGAAPAVVSAPKEDLSGKPAPEQQASTTSPAPVTETTPQFTYHIVKHGEIPSVLAKKYNVNVDDLKKINNWKPSVIWHVGDKIKLPINAHVSESSDSSKVVPPSSPITKQPATKPANDEPLAGRSAPAQTSVPAPSIPATDISGYTLHVIEPGERPSVLAKKYNVNVDDLKKINNWKPSVIWHVGDKVKLPPGAHLTEPAATPPVVNTPANPVVSNPTPPVVPPAATTAATEPGIQGTYIVQKKETLYSIGKKYKIPVAKIKSWNHLADDHISVGQALILYTQTPIVQSDTASAAAKIVPLAVKPTVVPQPVAPQPVVKPAAVQSVPKLAVDTAAANPQGYFTSLFGLNVAGRTLQTSDGMAMTFKTASGWNDRKYYVLMNDVSPGSIVKVSTADGKSVYAKVLWNMGDAKDNEGLTFRISDAAATTLGLKDVKFPVTVTYYK
jgi:LysM repeat protein